MPDYSSPYPPGLFHPGGTLGVPPFRGFPSQGAAPPYRRARCPPGVLSHEATDVHGFVSRGRPSPAHLGFAAGPFSPSGPYSPRESVRRDDRVYARHTSVPSWASASLRLSPPGKMGRISPPLLSRASTNDTPRVTSRSIVRRRPRVFLLTGSGVTSLEVAWPFRGFLPPAFSPLWHACDRGLLLRLEPQEASPLLGSPLRVITRTDRSGTRIPGRQRSGRSEIGRAHV